MRHHLLSFVATIAIVAASAGHGRRNRSEFADRRRHRLSGRRNGDPPDPPRSSRRRLDAARARLSAHARSVVAARRRRGRRPARHRRGRRASAVAGAAGQSAADRPAHRGAAGRARRRSMARSRPRRRAASSPSVLPKRRPPGLARRARRGRSAEWRAAFAAVAEEIATADTAIRDAKIKQRDIDREIARLEAERNATPPKKLEVRIDLNADAAAPAMLRVTYAVRGARWTPLYDARLDTGGKDRKPSLELIRRAEITQTTGEDWADVALAVSTVRTAHGGSAPDLRSLIVRYPAAGGPPRPWPTCAAVQCGRRRSRRKRELAAATIQAREAGRGAAGRARCRRLPGVFRIPGGSPCRAGQGAKSFRDRVRDHRARTDGACGAGAGRDRVPAGELQAG